MSPSLTSPISLVAANDTPLLGSLAGSDPKGASLSYGLEGAVATDASFDGISYDRRLNQAAQLLQLEVFS
jgi:hypothetical protein